MKLKRPSGANDYETLADMEGEGGVSTDRSSKSHDLGALRLCECLRGCSHSMERLNHFRLLSLTPLEQTLT